MWHKFTKMDTGETVFYYTPTFKHRVLCITFDKNPKYRVVAFRNLEYIEHASPETTQEDFEKYSNPYHDCIKCVFSTTSGIIGFHYIINGSEND